MRRNEHDGANKVLAMSGFIIIGTILVGVIALLLTVGTFLIASAGILSFLYLIFYKKITPTKKETIINGLFLFAEILNVFANFHDLERLKLFYILGSLSIIILHLHYNYGIYLRAIKAGIIAETTEVKNE